MKIEVTQPTLEGLFKDFYAVPAFQREYVWKEEQVKALLEDVFEALFDDQGVPVDTEYFIGSVVVYPDADKVYQLIDGQQRTTTLFICLCALRDLLREIDPTQDLTDLNSLLQVGRRDEATGVLRPRFRVTPLYEDAGGMIERIGRGEARTVLDTRKLSLSAKNMREAYDAVLDFLTRFDRSVQLLLRFYTRLTQRVRLVRIETPGVADALRIFETINDRGVGLNAMDLLKNLLFMKASKGDYDRMTGLWKEMTRVIEGPQVKEKPLRFLRYFLLSKYPEARRAAKPLTEDDLYVWLEENKSKPNVQIDANPLGFAQTLLEAAKCYAQYVVEPPKALRNISKLSARARQHMVVMLASQGLSDRELELLTRQLESLFVAYVLAKEPTKALDLVFANAAPKLRDLVQRVPAGAQREVALTEFLRSWVAPEIRKLRPRIDEALKRLSLERKTMVRFALARIAMYLDTLARVPVESIDRYWAYQIEHVLPNTPTDAQREGFDKPHSYDDYKQRLGNLALLEESINGAIGRDYFHEKQPHYQKSSLLMTKAISESQTLGGSGAWTKAAQKLSSFEMWDSQTIEVRHAQLAALCVELWGFDDAAH